MRIAHISTRLSYYGGEVCLANLARGFAARGHEVSCLVRPGSGLAAHLGGGPVSVVTMPLVDWFDPGTIRRVRGWLRGQRVDVLASHLPRDYFIAAVASQGLPVCNVATRHQLKPLAWPALKRPFLRGFGALVAVSDAVAEGVRQARLVPPERVTTVTNGTGAPGPAPAGPGLRARAGVPDHAQVIGFVGQISREKGVDFLIRAAGPLLGGAPDVHLFLIGGNGPDDGFRASLAGWVRARGLDRRVHFFGYLPAASAFVREFDIQVVPSVAEPFGLVTIEALANGVPVVATNTGGSPEIVRDGVEGFLVPAGDEAALANRLTCLLDSSGLRREMGQRGRLRHRQEFTIERMVRDTEVVYEQALVRFPDRAD